MADVGILELIKVAVNELASGNLPSLPIILLLASKALGYVVLLGAVIVKLPQIRVILKDKSAEGLSASSYELENIGLTIHTAYGLIMGLPFNTYGEASFLLLQNTILLVLVYYYSKTPLSRQAAMIAVSGAGFFALGSGLVTKEYIKIAYDFNNIIFIAARLPQIVKNFLSKSTGQLNIVAYIMNTGGCCIRIFTSLQEGGGVAMVRGFIISLILNLTLMSQILFYGKATKKTSKKKKEQ